MIYLKGLFSDFECVFRATQQLALLFVVFVVGSVNERAAPPKYYQVCIAKPDNSFTNYKRAIPSFRKRVPRF